MRGFHGCCLWALGLLLWWVSEGALDMLAFVCECWFMIWLLWRVLSFKMIITEDDSEEVLFSLFVRIPFRVSECRAVSQCMMNVLLIDGFHWFHVFNECCCSVSSWCGISWFVHYECDVAIILWLLWAVWNPVCFHGIVRWNDARSWIICCAKRRGLTGNGRIARFVMFAFSMVSFMSAGDVIMNAWDDSMLRSYLYVRDDEDCDDILSSKSSSQESRGWCQVLSRIMPSV